MSPQAAWPERLPLRKSGRCGIAEITERGALPMIDRGDIRQAIDSQHWRLGFTGPGAGYGQSEHKADSLIAKIQRSGRNGQRDLMHEQSHRDYLRSVICIIVCLSWAVNHYRDNHYHESPARQTVKRTEGCWTRRNYWHADASAWQQRCADAKYTKELADAKAENDAHVMMLPLVVVGCTSKQSVSQCVKPLPPPAWIMQPPPDWQTLAERDYFTLNREADHYAKTTGRNPEVY